MRITNLIVASLVVLGLSGCTHVIGTGEKVGTIINVSNEGAFFKTYEMEMVRGGIQGASGGFSVYCTINDGVLLQKVKRALDKQEEVEVHYVHYLFTPIASGSDSWFCVSMVPVPVQSKKESRPKL